MEKSTKTEKAATEERKLISGLTPRVLISIPIIVFLAVLTQLWTQNLTLWWAYLGWFPLPTIIYMVIFVIITRIYPKFELSPQEWVCFFTINYLCAGFWYTYQGISHSMGDLPSYTQLRVLWILGNEPYKSLLSNVVPGYMSPPVGSTALNAYFLGAKTMDWAAWMPHIGYWTVFLILITLMGFFWVSWLYKPLIEVQKLTYPAILPSIQLIENYTQKEDKKRRLFNIKLSRLFWIGFPLGFLLHLPDFLRFWLPAIPPGEEIRVHVIDLSPFTRGALPGAGFFGYFIPAEWPLYYMVPMDFLFSALVFYLVFAIIYPVVGIRSGILSYEPGRETNFGYYGVNEGPIKFNLLTGWGVALGLGLWVIYSNRSHFMGILRSVYSGAKGSETFGTPGIAYRSLGISTLLITLAFIIFLVGSAVPPLVAVAMVVTIILYHYGWTRFVGDIYEFWGSDMWWRYFYYDAGAISGAWPATPPAPVTQASFNTMLLGSATGLERTCVIGNPANFFNLYKLGSALNTSPWDVLKTATITSIIVAIIATPLTIWWCTFMGGRNNLGVMPRDTWAGGAVYAFLGGTPWPPSTPNPLERYGLVFGGIILVFIVYMLRARYPWFILNPTGWMCLPTMTWMWMNVLGMLIIKYLILKIGGARLFERGVPLAVGILTGYGVAYATTSFTAWILLGVPAASARL